MTDERQLSDRLKELGFQVGCSRSGKLLRLDCRGCASLPDHDLLRQVIRCSALKELYIPGCRGFLNESAGILAALPKLQVLDVEGSDFNDQTMRIISSGAGLTVINVRDTSVTADCVAELRKKMIGARIIF